MYFYLFLIFSNLATAFGLLLVFFQNPVYSILSLVACIFFSTMVLFIFGVEFMSFVYLVVYIGAISVLFLFIIMMLNINAINSLSSNSFSSTFFIYLCVFFKSSYSIFLTNENIYIHYLAQGEIAHALRFNYFVFASLWWYSGDSNFLIRSYIGNREKFVCDINNWPIHHPGVWYQGYNTFVARHTAVPAHFKVNYHAQEYYPASIQKAFLDDYPNLLISGLGAPCELASFCILYTTHFFYFILAGFVLLFALLGSISLCIVK